MDIDTVGTRIREIRKQKNLTQKELGNLCNMSDAQIRQYERGFRNPSLHTLSRISKGLNIPITDFLTTDENQINIDQKIGSRIRELRYDKAFYAEEFADLCGIPPFYVGVMETRGMNVSKELFSKIAKALDVTETYLILGQDDVPTETAFGEIISTFLDSQKNSIGSYIDGITTNEIEELKLLIHSFLELNSTGRKKVFGRIEELKELSKYTNKEE